MRPDTETYTCEECEDRGWVIEPDGGSGTAKRCRCWFGAREDRLPELLTASGVPPAYLDSSWETWEGQRPAAALEWQAEPRGVLFLTGPPGRGKTHAGTAVLRELLRVGRSCEWRDAVRLVDELRDLAAQHQAERLQYQRRRLERADVVLLDDLDKVRGTDFALEVIYGLIRARHQERRPLIVTSNLDLAGLVATPPAGLGWDSAIASRLRGVVVRVAGPDRRAHRDRGGEAAAAGVVAPFRAGGVR